MQLTGLEFTSSVRLTQANNALDIDVDLLTTSSKIDPNFYSMLFFDMLNGDVTGADGGGVTTGFLCKVYDTAGNLYTTTTVQKLDWYQVEKGYISEAISSITRTSTDVRLRKMDLFYIANNGGTAKEVMIGTSNLIATSSFASNDVNSIPGVLVTSTNGDTTLKVTFRFTINN